VGSLEGYTLFKPGTAIIGDFDLNTGYLDFLLCKSLYSRALKVLMSLGLDSDNTMQEPQGFPPV
jgi:hypothetical protein